MGVSSNQNASSSSCIPPGLHLAEQFLSIVLEFQEYYKEKCMSHTAIQFVFIVLEFQQYYNEDCMICKRHYYYCTLRKAAVLNTIVGHTNMELGGTVSMV